MIFRSRLMRALLVVCALTPAVGQVAEVAPRIIVMLPASAPPPAKLAADIAKWRADGLVHDVLRLDATGQNKPGFSTLLILEMTGDDAWNRWQSAAARQLPAGSRVRRVDAVVRSGDIGSAGADALFEVNVYRIKASAGRYEQFCSEYIAPLMGGQVDASLMTAYTMYAERTAEGDRNAVLVKAYRDAATFERVAAFKLELRTRLAAHPTYPKWHPIKDTLRDNVSETLAVRARGQ